MTFITVGSSEEYKFPRLLQTVDELCEEGVLDGKTTVAQVGYTEYKPKHYEYFDMISDEEFKCLVEKADVIITHAGTGSVISALKAHKKVIIFPRRFEFKEHLDNHQLELAELFASQGYTMTAMDKDELRTALAAIKEFKPREFISNNKKINQIIMNFIG